MRFAFACSAMVNVVLGVLVARGAVDPIQQPARSQTPVVGTHFRDGEASEKTPSRELRSNLGVYFDQLRASGLSTEATYLPVAGWLFRALASVKPGDDRYWRGMDPSRRYRLALTRLRGSLRRELVSLYGDDVASVDAFRGLFRPLGSSFDFLSARQQVAVSEHLASAVESDTLRAGCPSVSYTPGNTQATPALETLIGPQSFREFSMRVSPLAARLRPLELKETSFREAFSLLNQFLSSRDPARRAQLRRTLDDLLGAEASLKVAVWLDPVYSHIVGYLESSGLDRSVIELVYREVSDFQDELLARLSRGVSGAEEQIAASLSMLRERQRDRLAVLIGADHTQGLLRHLQQAAVDGDESREQFVCE